MNDNGTGMRPLPPPLSRREQIANERNRLRALEDRRRRIVAAAGLFALIAILAACIVVYLKNGGDPNGHYVYVPRPRRH